MSPAGDTSAAGGAAPAGVDGDGLRTVVQETLAAHRVLPSQVRDELSADPIRR
jgi:hypothetical protein